MSGQSKFQLSVIIHNENVVLFCTGLQLHNIDTLSLLHERYALESILRLNFNLLFTMVGLDLHLNFRKWGFTGLCSYNIFFDQRATFCYDERNSFKQLKF